METCKANFLSWNVNIGKYKFYLKVAIETAETFSALFEVLTFLTNWMQQLLSDPMHKAILDAAGDGHLDKVKQYLSDDLSLMKCVDKDGYTPLHRACYGNHPQVVEVNLLKNFLSIIIFNWRAYIL